MINVGFVLLAIAILVNIISDVRDFGVDDHKPFFPIADEDEYFEALERFHFSNYSGTFINLYDFLTPDEKLVWNGNQESLLKIEPSKSGSFGEVVLVDNIEHKFAMKVPKPYLKDGYGDLIPFENKRDEYNYDIAKETYIGMLLFTNDRHNFVRTYGTAFLPEQEERQYITFLELCKPVPQWKKHQDLTKIIQIQINDLLDFAEGAISTLQSSNIIHRDIKTRNFLLCNGDKHNLKLADFGLSCFKDECEQGTDGLTIGPQGYMSLNALVGTHVPCNDEFSMLLAVMNIIILQFNRDGYETWKNVFVTGRTNKNRLLLVEFSSAIYKKNQTNVDIVKSKLQKGFGNDLDEIQKTYVPALQKAILKKDYARLTEFINTYITKSSKCVADHFIEAYSNVKDLK